MRINPINEKITSEIRKVENARKHGNVQKGKSIVKSDSLSFSSDMRHLSETKANVEIIASKVASEPDIRTEKVNEVKKKIESGYYNSPEFIDKLTDKMLTFFSIPNSQK